MKTVFVLLLTSVLSCTGQVLLKKGVLAKGEFSLNSCIVGQIIKLVLNPAVFGGLIIYFISSILWLIALSKITLNFAYPFTAVTLALVMLSSRVIFLENIPELRYFGVILIILGVIFSSLAGS